MWQSVQNALLLLNRRVPLIQHMLPAKVVSTAAALLESVIVLRKPDRQYLTGTILPALTTLRAERVLFVGCRRYTKPYEAFFCNSEYWTLEINPVHAKWGAPRHKVGDARCLNAIFPPSYFDLVLFNGIFGFGINSDADIDRTIAALRDVMRPDGILLVGWNCGLSSDPQTRPAMQARFVHQRLGALPARKTFTGSTHVFDLFRTRIV